MQPIDLAVQLLKYRGRREDRARKRVQELRRRGAHVKDPDPVNIFRTPKPVSTKETAELPKPRFAFNDPEGKEMGHFDKRLSERTIHQQEADEVKRRVVEASRRFKLHDDPKLNQNRYAVITHRFPARAASEGEGMSDHLVTSVSGRYHPDFDNELVPTATTMYDSHSGRDYSGEYTHMLDMTTDPPSKTFLGYSNKSEPMDLAWQFLKHATSPEALRHKREYDTKYEDNPERKKYRAELSQARRKRGIMGQGGPDMSHTKEGHIVAEDPHANRARHFASRGTLK